MALDWYRLFRPWLFALPAETAHDLSMSALRTLQRSKMISFFEQPMKVSPRTVMGINFPNPLGLAAGLDKNGACIDAFAAMGFGFLEVGTVTPRPQPGNPKPRLFRIKEEQAIINRMGFNNHGVDALLENLKSTRFRGVLGINIGKNKDTPVAEAKEDYKIALGKVYPHATYVTVNISSPNTADLRQLQFGDALKDLLASLQEEQVKLQERYLRRVPIAVKIAPDLESDAIESLAKTFNEFQVDAVIATNTTAARPGVSELALAKEAGGLSGVPLQDSSTAIIKALRGELSSGIPIIGVGGICDAESAQAKLDAGASLLQLYSAFIYQGPRLVNRVLDGLDAPMESKSHAA